MDLETKVTHFLNPIPDFALVSSNGGLKEGLVLEERTEMKETETQPLQIHGRFSPVAVHFT